MTCIVNDIEENKNQKNLTLENGENINIKDYGYFFLSEAEGDLDREQVKRMVSNYRRLISELSQISEETVKLLML